VKAAKPEEKAPSACPPTAWKEPSGLFCIDAPGFTTTIEKTDDADDPEMRVHFKKPADGDKPELFLRVQWFLKRDAATQAVLRVTNLDDAYKNHRGKDQGARASTSSTPRPTTRARTSSTRSSRENSSRMNARPRATRRPSLPSSSRRARA
jgi:hypothetical protein